MFVADYVLMGYGTGAIMAVPGQDQRDWDFATVVRAADRAHRRSPPRASRARRSPATARRSTRPTPEISLDGLGVADAKRAIIDWLVGAAAPARRVVQYKLRDWLFSRQRYWGEPFPIVWDDARCRSALPEDQLPVELPEIDDYSPKTFDPDDADTEPEPPLSARHDWVTSSWTWATDRATYRRETNTMPQWAGSCWYYLRYLDPENDERFVDPEVEQYWMGKDPARPGDDPAGSTCTSAASSTPCCTCCTPGSGTRCCSTWATSAREEPFRGCSTRATSRPSPTPTRAASTCRPRRSSRTPDGGFTWNGAARHAGSTGRWASR